MSRLHFGRMSSAFPLRVAACLAVFATVAVNAPAQEEGKTIPVGCIVLDIPAGTGSTRTTTLLSFPLKERATIPGAAVGRLTGVTSNSLSNSGAAWTPGALSNPASPYLIRITSGAAEGLTLLISTVSPNTATTVSIGGNEVAAVDLTTLGIQTGSNGDTYEIVPCDTLLGIFGTPATTGIVGGADPSTTDQVMAMVRGAWQKFYFNTTAGEWRRVGAESLANNLPISPDTAVLYGRIGATPIELVVTGEVPSSTRRAVIPASGTFLMARSWPTDGTLGSSGIADIPNWRSSSDPSQADLVLVFSSGSWTKYYHDGTNWRTVEGAVVSDSVALSAGAGVMLSRSPQINRTGELLSENLPYNL